MGRNYNHDYNHRIAILEHTSNLLSGPRAESYGDFGEQMRSIAGAFTAITGEEISPNHVAILLMLLKLRRLETGWDLDSCVDLAGYAALIGEYFTDG